MERGRLQKKSSEGKLFLMQEELPSIVDKGEGSMVENVFFSS